MGTNGDLLMSEGELVIDLVFDYADDFVHGLALVKKGPMWGFVNQEGELAIMPEYERAWSFEGPLARAFYQGVNVYLNKSGEIVWPEQ